MDYKEKYKKYKQKYLKLKNMVGGAQSEEEFNRQMKEAMRQSTKSYEKKENKRPSITPALISKLCDYGLKYRDVGSDGNCYFRAISYSKYRNEKYYKDLRSGYYQFMKKTLQGIKDILQSDTPKLSTFQEDFFEWYNGKMWDEEMERMKKDKAWVDNDNYIRWMSYYLKRNIRIFVNDGSMKIHMYKKDADFINIVWMMNLHYMSTEKDDSCNSRKERIENLTDIIETPTYSKEQQEIIRLQKENKRLKEELNQMIIEKENWREKYEEKVSEEIQRKFKQ